MARRNDKFSSTPARRATSWLALLPLSLITACADVPLPEVGGALSSYQQFQPSDGLLTKAQVSIDTETILAARTVQIIPTAFSASARESKLSETERTIVANAVDRSVCIGLSDRFEIILPPQKADLTVRISIANLIATDETAAVASKVLSVGTTVVTGAGIVETSVPIPSIRVPIGLGGLALEAEAVDTAGNQRAAMLWARGANAFVGRTRVSPVGDAYELASSFGEDFSELLVKGRSPFDASLPSLPSRQRIVSFFGGAPDQSACDAFGRVGVTNLLAGSIGLPPEWTDDGAQVAPQTR